MEPKARKKTRHLFVAPDLKAALEARRVEADIPETRQIIKALEMYLEDEPENAHRALLRPELDADRVEKTMPVPEALWERLRERKKLFGFALDDQLHIALTLYFAELNGVDPFTNKALSDASQSKSTRPGISDDLRALGVRTGTELASLEKKAPLEKPDPLLAAARIVLSNAAFADQDTISIWGLPTAPCGPWKTILNDAEPIELPRRLARVLGAQEGDLLVPIEGQSMVEAGVPEGGEVIMRPLRGKRPQVGQIVLCSIEREGDVWESTIKIWFETPRGAPLLKDGKSNDVPLPNDVVEVHPVAVLVGVMGRATYGTVKGPSTEAKAKRRRRRSDDDPLSE